MKMLIRTRYAFFLSYTMMYGIYYFLKSSNIYVCVFNSRMNWAGSGILVEAQIINKAHPARTWSLIDYK